jgi:two-component system OmpR family sensor kinase
MGGKVRVLYVGASGAVGEAGPQALERADSGLAVEPVDNGDAALEQVTDGFDCVVVGPSEGNATQLLGSIRERAPATPVVLAAGDEPVDAAVATGVTHDRAEESVALLAAHIRAAVDSPPVGPASRGDSTHRRPETFADVAFYVDETGEYREVVAGGDSPLLYGDPETVVGEQMQARLPADTAERLQRAVRQTLDTGEVQTVEYSLEVAVGVRWVEAILTPADRAGTDSREVLLVARDITGQKEHERALEALHEMATTIQTAETVERACELTVTAAADILEFEMCSVVIQEGDWLVPYAVSESARPDGARTIRVEEGLAGKTFEAGESYVVDQVRPDDDTSPAFEGIQSGLSVPIGEHGVFQAVSTEQGAFSEEDITLAELLVSHTTTAIDRIEREEALTRKTERLEEFASFVSHDLRNPLNVASLRLELLEEECNSQHVGGLSDALDRMERLIDELLTLARHGETIGDTEQVSLADVVSRAWSNVETSGATLVCETDQTLYADRNRLTAVLENLIRNAVEHGATSGQTASDDATGGGSVTVTVGELPEGRGFYFADDGEGVPESAREEVFESGYSTAEDGTGFGLAIVRDIVGAHGWSVQVTDSEDGGARFEVTGVELAE